MDAWPETALADLVWQEIPVRLRNVRVGAPHESPLWVFHGLLAHAAPRLTPERIAPFWFRFRSAPPGAQLRKGEIHDLDVILAGADPATSEGFTSRLRAHLAPEIVERERRNFLLESIGSPRFRRLADLATETAPWPDDTDEV